MFEQAKDLLAAVVKLWKRSEILGVPRQATFLYLPRSMARIAEVASAETVAIILQAPWLWWMIGVVTFRLPHHGLHEFFRQERTSQRRRLGVQAIYKHKRGWLNRSFPDNSSRPTSEALNLEMSMRAFTAVIERCPETGLFVGYVPGFPGAHSQGETLDELQQNLTEVIGMLLEDGEPQLESEFIGIQKVQVA